MNPIVICAALLGTIISSLNFYLSFIRPLAHHYWKPTGPYKQVSGFPLFGSVLLWGSAIPLWSEHLPLALACLAIAALDTLGLHWLLISLCISIRRPNQQ